MSIDPINEAFIAAASLQASDDIHKSFRKTFDLSQCTKVIPDTLTLLVRSLSDEIEARFEKSFAQRDAELVRLRSEVILLRNEAAKTLVAAQEHSVADIFKTNEAFEAFDCFITDRLKRFVASQEFEESVGQYFTDNWTSMQDAKDVDLDRRIRSIMCDILRHTAFVIPTS